jgi:hypothetical protein
MTEDRLSRIGPLCAVLFFVLTMGGFAIGAAGGGASVTLGDSTAKVLKAYADPMGSGVWVGAYLTVISLAAFAVFVAWLFRSRRGPLSTAGMLAAATYVAMVLAASAVNFVLDYRAGHGMGSQTTLALFYLQEALFVLTWAASAAFLALAPVSGWLRYSARVLAGLCLVAVAVPTAGWAQFPPTLFYVWMLVAGIALARRRGIATSPVPQGGLA